MSGNGAPGTPPPDAAASFWGRLPHLLPFPLQRAPLLRLVAAALLGGVLAGAALGTLASQPAYLVTALLAIACGGALLTTDFAVQVLERTASGYLDSRAYPRAASQDWGRSARMLLLLMALPLLAAVAASFLPAWAGRSLLLAVAAVLPASIVVLVQTDGFSEAIQPQRCANTALGIGGPYALLCLFLLGYEAYLQFGAHEIAHALARAPAPEHAPLHTLPHALPHAPPHPPPPAPAAPGEAAEAPPAPAPVSFGLLFCGIAAVGNYLLLLYSVLAGYAMYCSSEALGIAVVGPGDARVGGSRSGAAHLRRQREALIGKMAAAGEFREALDLLGNDLRERPNDLALHARLHALLLQEGSRVKIEAHAERYLELLLASSNLGEALALWTGTRAMFPEFVLRHADHGPVLAREALRAGNPAQAAEILRGFDRRFPGHPKIPEVYVIGARILLVGGQPAQARQLLQHVVARFPADPAAGEAKRYLARFP